MSADQHDKPYLSPSQLDMYCRCGEQYRRRYLEGEKLPPGIAAVKGTGFHGGAAVNMRQKIESHCDLPKIQIVDAAVAEFEAQLHGEIALTPEELSRGTEIVFGEAKDDLVVMAGLHASEQAPDYQPIIVEQRIRIELQNSPRDLLGVIDLADDTGRVIDFKTAAKRKTQADADDSVQLTTYAAAYHAHFGSPPSELRLDTVVRTKTKVYRDVQTTTRSGADMEALANRINVVTEAIEAGVFAPATPGAWWCSSKWCGYFHTCRYVNSQRESLEKGYEV